MDNARVVVRHAVTRFAPTSALITIRDACLKTSCHSPFPALADKLQFLDPFVVSKARRENGVRALAVVTDREHANAILYTHTLARHTRHDAVSQHSSRPTLLAQR